MLASAFYFPSCCKEALNKCLLSECACMLSAPPVQGSVQGDSCPQELEHIAGDTACRPSPRASVTKSVLTYVRTLLIDHEWSGILFIAAIVGVRQGKCVEKLRCGRLTYVL